jgi:3,4-dihydroxy-2-butanone 4-phosphate synthase
MTTPRMVPHRRTAEPGLQRDGVRALAEQSIERHNLTGIITPEDVYTEKRKDRTTMVIKREIAHELRERGLSLVRIADLMGYVDHTSVINLLKNEGRRG